MKEDTTHIKITKSLNKDLNDLKKALFMANKDILIRYLIGRYRRSLKEENE